MERSSTLSHRNSSLGAFGPSTVSIAPASATGENEVAGSGSGVFVARMFELRLIIGSFEVMCLAQA